MTRLSGLLEDDLATTRQLACRSLDTMFSLLYNGLGHILAAHPANWLVPVSKVVSPSTVAISAKSGSSVSGESAESLNFKDHFEKTEFSRQVAECCPLPGALGDQIYRYYPNLLNRLDDANDEVRILTTEVLISWNYLMLRQLTEPASTDISHSAVSDHSGSLTESAVVTAEAPKSSDSLPSSVPVLRQRRVRSVHSAVLDDLISKIVVHLDDPEAKIRGAVARVLLRLGRHFSKKSVFRALSKARECHRSVDVCEALENLLIASA
ncbi:unnamed protein product [Protopolystoma xenopodis]|uniref:Condensin complex subunit 1 C-terminal domain-containing protein n=1 Tax=Protopolystoma xenopodis TaxID=117903 RepID=A0A448WCX6_9PLAT|nr:unnamed protein product [Protopolystoma xenopodis]